MPTLASDQQIPAEMRQPEKLRIIAERTTHRIAQMDLSRYTKYPILRNRTPLQAMEDSLRRVAQYKVRPSYKKSWQANMPGSIIADKLFVFLAKLAAQAPVARAVAADDISYPATVKARVSNMYLRHAGQVNRDDFMVIMEMLEAMEKGLVVGIEAWKHYTKPDRRVLDEDPETHEYKLDTERTIAFDNVWGDIWPAEHVLFGDVNVSHVQKMPDIALERVVKWDTWQTENRGMAMAKYVQPRGRLHKVTGNGLFWTPSTVADDEVFEALYYNQETNEFLRLANGIWMNPLGSGQILPIPFAHRKLPVWSVRFRPLRQNFIYGASHPDTMITSSDTYDKVMETMLDSLIIALNAPIAVDEKVKGLTDGYLYPGKQIKLPPGAKAPERIDLSGISQEGIQFLNILQQRLEQNSASADFSPTTGKTATQVVEEQQMALETVALFLRMMEFGVHDKAELRLPNCLQYYSFPSVVKNGDAQYRTFVLRDQKLSSGKTGTQKVTITPKPSQTRVMRENMLAPGQTETWEVSPAWLRDANMEIVLVPGQNKYRSEAIMQALELNKQRVIAALYPQKFAQFGDALWADLVRVYDMDETRYTAPQQNAAGPGSMFPGLPIPGQPLSPTSGGGGLPQIPYIPRPGQGNMPNPPSMPKEPTLKESLASNA